MTLSKKTVLTILLILIVDLVFAYKHKGYYSNGQLRAVDNYKKGVVTGVFKRYYQNGQLEVIGNPKEGTGYSQSKPNDTLEMNGKWVINKKSIELTSAYKELNGKFNFNQVEYEFIKLTK